MEVPARQMDYIKAILPEPSDGLWEDVHTVPLKKGLTPWVLSSKKDCLSSRETGPLSLPYLSRDDIIRLTVDIVGPVTCMDLSDSVVFASIVNK